MVSQERGHKRHHKREHHQNHHAMTPTVQNLNSKLSPRPRAKSPRVAAANRHLARSFSTPVRTIAPRSGYRGGYLIDA